MSPQEVDDWIYGQDQQQQELERERFLMTMEALDRCAAAGAKVDDLVIIAKECGIPNYKPNGGSNATHK